MILETRAAPPFMKNGFVLGCEDTREGVVIDPGDEVEQLLEAVVLHARQRHAPVACGVFGADMQVQLVNDGPVTVPLTIR